MAPSELIDRLATLTDRALAPIRDGTRIHAALRELRDIRADVLPMLAVRQRERAQNRDWSNALECRAAIDVLDAALLGADARTRSLGAHRRADSPPAEEGSRPRLEHGIVSAGASGLVHRRQAVAFPVLAP